jgi:pilus assembly protein CpaC
MSQRTHTPRMTSLCSTQTLRRGLLLLGSLALASGSAFAQMSSSAAEPVSHSSAHGLEVTVSRLDTPGELVRVAVNKAILLNFNLPVDRARLINDDIATVNYVSPFQLVLTGRSFGTTQLICEFNGNGQKVFDVAVDLELDRLAASIRSAVPQAKVNVNSLLDAVVLTGTAPDTASAERIQEIAGIFSERVINHLEVAGTQQVLLRCTVAEVNRTATRQLGFNGWIAGDNVPSAFGLSNIGGINPSNISAPGGYLASPPQALGNTVDAAVGGIIPFTTGAGGIPVQPTTTLSVGFPQVPMQIFIQALRENGLLRVLAEPNLVSISGQSANFLAGGEIPIPVDQGNDGISLEYKEFGVKLEFTPTVLNEGQIRLHVRPSISELDFANAVTLSSVLIPAISSRTVETLVEVGSGQTIAIGGLLSERLRGTASKVPGLGDIPVLGALFSSVEYQSEESELVVLVTPELVSPISPQQVAPAPGSLIRKPSDGELFLMGQLEGQEGDPSAFRPYPQRTRGPQNPIPQGGGELHQVRGPVGSAGLSEGF